REATNVQPDRLTPQTIELLAPHGDVEALRNFRARTAIPWRWLPRVLRADAVTLGPYVSFRPEWYDQSTPAGLALIAHECVHIRQYRQMGFVPFLVRYAIGAVRTRFVPKAHPMEREPYALQQRV